MASVYDAVEALQVMGLALKAMGEEADKTKAKVREAKAESTTAGMTKQGTGPTVESIGASYGGDPRDASDSAMRMNAAIQAAMRGR